VATVSVTVNPFDTFLVALDTPIEALASVGLRKRPRVGQKLPTETDELDTSLEQRVGVVDGGKRQSSHDGRLDGLNDVARRIEEVRGVVDHARVGLIVVRARSERRREVLEPLDRVENVRHVVELVAAVLEFGEREVESHRSRRRLVHGSDRLVDEPCSISPIVPVGILAFVVLRGEKLAKYRERSRVQLHTVEPGTLEVAGRRRKSLDQRVDLLIVHRLWHFVGRVRGGRRRSQLGLHLPVAGFLVAGMSQLTDDPRVSLVNRVYNRAQPLDRRVVVRVDVRRPTRGGVNEHLCWSHHEPGSTRRSRTEMGR